MGADLYDKNGNKIGRVVHDGDRLGGCLGLAALLLIMPGFLVSLSGEIDLKPFVASHQKFFTIVEDVLVVIVLIALLFLVYKIIAAIVRGIKSVINKLK